MRPGGTMRLEITAALIGLLAAAGPAAAASQGAVNDPFERANRISFLATGALDYVLIRPAAVVYAHAAPRPVRLGVRNLLGNLNQPVYAVNHALQLRPTLAAQDLGRFLINSTAGVGGLIDVAASAGLKDQPTGFGRTLGRYGVSAGPYVFLPVFGPSSVRDAVGQAVDVVTDPLFWARFPGDFGVMAARSALGALDARVAADPALKELQATATDPYASLRAAYVQNAAFLQHGGKIDVQSLPDFDTDAPPAPPVHP